MQKETGFQSILKERIEQVRKHGRSVRYDRDHTKGELLKAAKFCRTLNNADWPRGWMKEVRDHIKRKSVDERLVIEASFIAAEIDRMRGIEPWEFEWGVETVQQNKQVVERIDREQEKLRHYASGTLNEKLSFLINHYSGVASKAVIERDELIENMRVYLQSFVMLTESIGMASTHGEKAARLRGMVELLNSTIKKLSKRQIDSFFDHWNYGMFGSDFPYQNLLDKLRDLKSENESLKQQLNPNQQPAQEDPGF